jgi:recombinational DNA repair ATPase RecF
MRSAQLEREQMELSATNIGGIDDTDVTFQPGVTVLAGRNATNRTSLLQALMGRWAAMPSRSKGMLTRATSS